MTESEDSPDIAMNENTKKIIDKLSVSFVDPIEYYFFCVVHIIDIRSDKTSKLNSIFLNAILPIVKTVFLCIVT
jgi:hypothetical protein